MSDKLNGKVAAITGATSGIGLACAKAMLDDLAWWTEAARAQRERAAPPY